MLKRPRRRGVSAVRTQAGSAQTGLHGGYLAQLDRLATADLAEPEIQGRIAELLTADYEAEVAARREAKATALQEVYCGLRDGDDRPASLPPDLAVLLSEAERAEIEAWWQGGLAVAPDAALFEGLIALPPDALLALDLSRPALARHLSESETARLQSLQAELRRQRGRAPAAGGEGVGGDGIGGEAEGGEVGGGAETPGALLTELNATLEALDVGAGDGTASDGTMNETAPDPWGVNRRRVGSLPEQGDPRETQVAVGIFGDDEGDGEEGGGEGGEEREEATGTPAQDASPGTEAPPASAEEEKAAAEALADLIERASDLSGLSEQEIEALGREALKLIPGVGAPLSYQDGVEALSQARRALEDKHYWTALQAAGDGLVELSGIVPGVGAAARGVKVVGRAVGRAALDILDRVRKTPRGQAPGVATRPRGVKALMPPGTTATISTKSGVRARVDVSGKRAGFVERLHTASEDVGATNAKSVSGLIDGGRLTTSGGANKHIVNIDRGGGRTEAEEAFHRAIRDAGGDPKDIGSDGRQGWQWTSPDGTRYEFYESPDNADTVVAIIPSSRAPASGRRHTRREWNLKVRFRGQP